MFRSFLITSKHSLYSISRFPQASRQIGDMEKEYPFILNVTEGVGDIFLTTDEHKALAEYFRLSLKKDNIERKQIYCRGHTDGCAYLKK